MAISPQDQPGGEIEVPDAPKQEGPARRLFRFVGGGPTLGGPVFSTPPFYRRAIYKLLSQFDSAAWQEWWSLGGQPECLIFTWVGGRKTEPRVRRSRHQVYAACERAIEVDDKGPVDPGAHAVLADAEALVAKLRSRFDLPEPPSWIWVPSGPVGRPPWKPAAGSR